MPWRGRVTYEVSGAVSRLQVNCLGRMTARRGEGRRGKMSAYQTERQRGEEAEDEKV